MIDALHIALVKSIGKTATRTEKSRIYKCNSDMVCR